MAFKSGLVALVASVGSTLAARGVTANVSLGWTRRYQNLNQGPGGANRIVFQPSDDSGKGGAFKSAHLPGPRVSHGVAYRSLANVERSCVMNVWASDATKPGDDSAQIEAVETLLEAAIQAVQAFPGGNATNVAWGELTWTVPPAEMRLGAEARVAFVFKHPIFDAPNVLVTSATPAVHRDPST